MNKQIPSLRCGMTKSKDKYGDSGFARMTTWGIERL
jgi:hypothetical protein